MEKLYLAGVFDDDPTTLTVVERLLASGAGVMETERKRRAQTNRKAKAAWRRHVADGTVDHRKTGRPRKEDERMKLRPLPEDDREGDESYAEHLGEWLEARA